MALRARQPRFPLWTLVLLTLPVLAATGCQSLRIDRPIGVRTEALFGEDNVALLKQSADCWNLQFGTFIEVNPPRPLEQEVQVAFNDFVCTHAVAQTDTTLPVTFHVCPPRHFSAIFELQRVLAFQAFVHELGHVLNIREEGTESASVMGMAAFVLPWRFTEEDRRLLAEGNPGLSLQGACGEVRFVHPLPEVCVCRCR